MPSTFKALVLHLEHIEYDMELASMTLLRAVDGGGSAAIAWLLEEAEDAAGHVLQEHRPAQGDPAEGGPRVSQTPRHAVTKSKISNSTQQVCNSLTSRFE